MKRIFVACLVCAVLWIACEGEEDETGMPEVAITSPADGSEVSGMVLITADATDDEGIVSVDFYIDDSLVATGLMEPYDYLWSTYSLEDSSSHTIYAKAYDTDSNEATSEAVTVTVILIKNFEAADDFNGYNSSTPQDTIYALLDGNGNWSSVDWNVMREELAFDGNYVMVRDRSLAVPGNYATYHLTAPGNIDTLTVGFTFIKETHGTLTVLISPDDSVWVDITSEFGIVTVDTATTTSADLTAFVVDFGTDVFVRFQASASGNAAWYSAIDDFWVSGTVE